VLVGPGPLLRGWHMTSHAAALQEGIGGMLSSSSH
jgi:hypothetical protein